jgi:hypothetical protein
VLEYLYIADSSGLNVSTAGDLTVNGSLINHGTIIQTKAVSGSSNIGFFDTGNYGGVLLNPNGEDLGSTTVTIIGGRNCTTTDEDDTVHRCFDISPTNSPTTGSTITFFFDSSELNGLNCNNLEVYHDNAGTWETMTRDTSYDDDGRLCGSDPQSLRIVGVTDYSGFAIAEQQPTAITMSNFSARSIVTLWVPVISLLGLLSIAIALKLQKSTN